MCGRYAIGNIDFKNRYSVSNYSSVEKDLTVRFNVAPGQENPTIVKVEKDTELRLMRWGLVPSWAKDEKIGYKMINARAETVDEKPSYKRLLKSQRCLIPATGFYEWLKAKKQPYYIHLKDQDIFSFAGLYDKWKNPSGNELDTYTIITTNANKALKPIHDRMPVILKPEDEQIWLSNEGDPDFLKNLLEPFPSEKIEAYPVNTSVNNPRNDDRSLIEKLNSQ